MVRRASPKAGKTSKKKEAVIRTESALQPVLLEVDDEPKTSPLDRAPIRVRERNAALLVISGRGEGDIYKIKPGDNLTIGRGEHADIRLLDHGVSRAHAKITCRREEVTIEDLESRNGIFVEGQKVERHRLAAEDLISVGGSTVLKFCLIDAVEETYRLRMQAAALRDPLTGAFNRRYFDNQFAGECAASRRHRRPLSLLLLDIDDFKRVNDHFGHPAGDIVLRTVAETLAAHVRREDFFFRYGGEEFAILARETAHAGAFQLGERLVRAVAAHAFNLRKEKRQQKTVTISIGVSEYDRGDEAAFVAKADAALYRAKREGKNRAVLAKTSS
jgi:two-component system, cell cycle response regulator